MVKFGGLCLLIVAMNVGAGIQAEVAENKHLRLWIVECRGRDPSRDAFKLALLTVAHVLANLLGGCMCGNISGGIVDAGDRDTIKRQVQGVVWADAPPFAVHRRDIVLCSWAVFG
ncbi:hypothetical protein V6N13_106370 [Hibiscus sabdariffa]|uniref:Secreted protein n=1 Tax=Hibiscus sabdariffa TaxID=183260 RepID=A0ABR2F0J7_9ROSI